MATPEVINELSDLGLIPEPIDVEVAVRQRFTMTEATVVMKFVSPTHRGTQCTCR